MEGVITVRLDGATFSETKRFEIMIHHLFTEGVFNIKNGHAIIHFDHEGAMRKIERHFMRDLSKPISKETIQQAKIEALIQ